MYRRQILACLTLIAAGACAGESDWLQKCVLTGKTRAACACLEKDLKPEWRDFVLMDEVNQMDALSNIGTEAFIAFSNATSKCVAAS